MPNSDHPPRWAMTDLATPGFVFEGLQEGGFYAWSSPGYHQSGILYDSRAALKWGYAWTDEDGQDVVVYAHTLEHLCRLLGLIARGLR